MEKYEGSVKIKFDDIPLIQLVSIKSESNAGLLERLSMATRRRRFILRESWQVEINGIEYLDQLNGTIEIPHKDKRGEKIKFDGASTPFPWLISLLTIGILRPLGVMLIGSIIHDYIYRYGSLRVASDGANFKDIEVPRHKADKLFRDIIGTVNGMPVIGYIGWFFVRIGWPFVRFNGNYFGGRKPIPEYILFLLILVTIAVLICRFGWNGFSAGFVGSYICFYIISIILNKIEDKKRKRVS